MNVVYRSVAIPVSPDVSPVKMPADKKTVNLAPTISNLQNDILEDVNRSIDTDDGDSRDNEDLVIDMKEEEMHEDRSNEDKFENDKCKYKDYIQMNCHNLIYIVYTKYNGLYHIISNYSCIVREKTDDDLEKPFVCKHCQTTFNRQRGLKMHIQFSHLKRLSFLCPYCDRSTNSETMMRQHIRAKHPNDPEKIIHNPDAWGNTKLSDEFWEKEYGLYPMKTKKRKLNTENNVSNNVATTTDPATTVSASTGNRLEKCELCSFTAMNYAGLKSHMRIHTAPKRNLKCLYCTYSCFFKAEMMEHWKVNHPSMPLKFKELSAAGFSSSETKGKPSTPQKRDASKNTEEEHEASTIIYGCFYCNLRSNSLQSIKQHWNLMHKRSETAFNAKFPFRYKELSVMSILSSMNSAKKETEYDQAKQTEKQTPVIQQCGWICQWCQEFCETNNDRIRHQNMFHSHLPYKWQEQQKEQDQSQE